MTVEIRWGSSAVSRFHSLLTPSYVQRKHLGLMAEISMETYRIQLEEWLKSSGNEEFIDFVSNASFDEDAIEFLQGG